MVGKSRVGTGLLLAGALILFALMAYTLSLGGGRLLRARAVGPSSALEVAVFVPERADWLDFRHGTTACRDRGLLAIEEDTSDALLVLTPRQHRIVRLSWHGVRGVRQTYEEARRLMRSESAPLAFVGSGNTMLSVALAEELRHAAASGPGTGRNVPVLLLPWATAVLASDPERGPGPVALLDIFAGRTFRFCLDDEREAELVVGALTAKEPKLLPHRVYIVVDRHDPYSRDLGEAFHRSIENIARSAEIVEQAGGMAVAWPGDLGAAPDAAERAWAEDLWRMAGRAPGGSMTWVVLPLQEEPARRLLVALADAAPVGAGKDAGTLRVLSGDALGMETVLELAGRRALSLWCLTPASVHGEARASGALAADDAQIPAEIVSALVQAIDQPGPTPKDLRPALVALDLKATDHAAFGRRLAFAASGERAGNALGHVLATGPARAEVQTYALAPDGTWRAAAPIPAAPVAVRP